MIDSNLLKELIFIYGSTTVLSESFNYFYHTRRVNKAITEGERNLVYKDLSTSSYLDLSDLKKTIKLSNKIAAVLSAIPFVQIIYTINNIKADPNYLNRYYNSKIEEINAHEIRTRMVFLKKIKKANNLPSYIEEKLKDKEYLPSEEDYRTVLDYNNSDFIVKTKKLTITRKNNDSK